DYPIDHENKSDWTSFDTCLCFLFCMLRYASFKYMRVRPRISYSTINNLYSMSEFRNMSTSLEKINFIRTLQREEKLDGNLYRACINELCNSGCHEEAFNIFKSYKESIL